MVELDNIYLNIKIANENLEHLLVSKNFILFYGEKIDSEDAEYGFVIMPSFNKNKIQLLNQYESISADFLFYHDEYYCKLNIDQNPDNYFIRIFLNYFS